MQNQICLLRFYQQQKNKLSMDSVIDPNFDQLLIICGIICVIVIGFVLFMIKFPEADNDYNNDNEQ